MAAWLLLEATFAGLAIWWGLGVVVPLMRGLLVQAIDALASRG